MRMGNIWSPHGQAEQRAIDVSRPDDSWTRGPRATEPRPWRGRERSIGRYWAAVTVLDRRGTWSDKQAYDETARGLTQRFEANFREYEPFVGSEIKEVAIRAAA